MDFLFLFSFFHGSMEKFNQLAKRKYFKMFLSSIKTNVPITFPKKKKKKKKSAENQLGAERVHTQYKIQYTFSYYKANK